ncbi:MAG TPA: VanZ family protein [Casimicrobiaceae bacterium]
MPPSAVAPRRPPTRLPQYLAALYALMIVYASLAPFSGWMAPLPDTPFFLLAPWPARFTRADVAINAIAYAPFGLLLALIGRRPAAVRLARALGIGALLSLAMESLQMFLPMRDASSFDFFSNAVGIAVGCGAALALDRARDFRERVAQWRYRVFLDGRVGDLGLSLLAVWLASQLNPGIPLFAATFDPSLELARDVAGTLLQAAQSAFNVVGVGLFLALLLRQRRHLGGAVLALIGLALLLKSIAALLLLKSAAWESWLKPGVSAGVAVGALLLMLAIRLPRPVRTALCAIALLSSLVAPLLAPDMWQAHAPLAMFDWPYGQLLHFNGLTRAVLVLWPVLASTYLLWLAGQPGWGQRSSPVQADDRDRMSR